MSNNLKAKNLIYSFNKHNELPYQSSQMIEYGVNQQYANMVQLNNTYGQCIDNDMFIAKTFINQLNGTSQPGPKLLVDKASIDALPDGAKFFSSAGSSNIMQKHVNSLASSLKISTNANFKNIQFIHKINSSTVLLCTLRKTFVMSTDSISSNGAISNVAEVKLDDGQSFVITAVFWHGKLSSFVFAGHSYNKADYGLYMLSGYSKNSYSFTPLHVLQGTKKICAMSSDDSSSAVVFATNTTLYVCDMQNETISNVKSIASFSSATGTICALIAFSENAIVFTSTGKIYYVNYASKYYGFIDAECSQTSQDSIKVNGVQYANGVQYLATSIGLCIMEDNQMHQINENYTSEVKCIAVGNDGTLWCGDSAGRILVSTNSSSLELYAQLDSHAIEDIMIVDDVKLVISDGTLMYERSHGDFNAVSDVPSSISLMQMIKRPNTSNEIYVVGSDDGFLYASHAKIQIGQGDENYEYIDGISSILDFGNAEYNAYDVDIVKLVNFNQSQYAFVNFASKNSSTISYSRMIDVSTHENALDDINGQIQGIVQVNGADNNIYVFTQQSNVIKLHADSSHTISSYALNNPFDSDVKIIDSQMIDEDTCFITFQDSSGYNLAYARLADNQVYVYDTVYIGTSSNIVKHNDNYLAFTDYADDKTLSSFNVSYAMQENDVSANSSFPEELTSQTERQFQIYGSDNFQIVNNLSYRIDGSLMYRRADYIVPQSTMSNIIALQSFIQIDNNSQLELQCMSAYEIDGTSNISFVDGVYDRNNSNTATGYVKDNSAVYTFQVNDTDSKIFNPSSPFTTYNKIIRENVNSLALEQVVVEKQYSSDPDTYLTSCTAGLTSYEMMNDGSLKAVECSMTSSINDNSPNLTSNEYAVDGLNGATALMLSRYLDKVYVLLQDDLTTYSVKSIEHSGHSYSLSSIGIDGIHSESSPKAFVFEHEYIFNGMLSYLSDIIDGLSSINVDNSSFENFVNALQENGYTYEVDHETVQTISSSVLNIVFDDAKHMVKFSNDYSHSSEISTVEWLNADVDAAIALNGTDSMVENALLTYNTFGLNFTMQMLFKTSYDSQLYAISDNKLIYGNPVPESMSGIDFISKDIALDRSIMSDHGQLSVIGHDFNVEYETTISYNAQDINLIQCCNESFSSLRCIAYTAYDSSTGTYETRIDKSNGVHSILTADFTYHKLMVLNNASELRYPVMSYFPIIGTIDYEHYINDVVFNAVHSCNSTIQNQIKCIAVDASDSSYSNIYMLNGKNLYKTDFEHYMLDNVYSFNGIQSIVCGSFAGSMFGDGRYALMNIVAADGSHKTVSFTNNASNTVIAEELYLLNDIQAMVAAASYSFMQYDNGMYMLYGHGNGSFSLQFTGIGMVNENIQSTHSLNANESVNSVLKLDKANEYALQTAHSIYRCTTSNVVQELKCELSNACNVGFITAYENDESHSYYASISANVISSSNLSSWKPVLTAGSNSSDAKVNAFSMLNPYIALISRNDSSLNGLYYTYYNYYVDSNTESFTAESAYYAYYDNESKIDALNTSALNKHIEYHHLAANSDISLINNCMDRSFPLPSSFMSANSALDFSNDYIDRILIGNSYDENIIVYACNSANSNKWSQLTCSYIAKCWKSGMTELYINIPTTLTYYIPHIEGASQCNGFNESIDINGRTLTSNIKDNVTSIRVNVASEYFTVDTLAENTIKVNSLPLRIYKDDTYENACTGAMWHSFICPSIAESFEQSDLFLGYYTFNYYCFGSDAQAVKLTFMDNSPNYDRKYKTIVYHANGGTMTRFPGMKSITQRIYEGDEPVKLYWEIFSKEGSFFIGWSQSAGSAEGDNAYSSGTTVSYSSMKMMKLTLHACWLTYKFDQNDTTLTIANTVPGDYTIAEITIDPNAAIPNNPQLGNKLIIDYGG